MLLSCRFLDNYVNANTYTATDTCTFTEGDTKTITIELLDASSDVTNNPPGRIYIAAANATLKFTIQSINDALVVNAVPTITSNTPFWQFNLAAGAIKGGTYTVSFVLTEGTQVTNGFVNCRLRVIPAGNFSQGAYYPPGYQGPPPY